ncbi:hypothetical protein [Longimicrobium sp.]|uniref:hypothetical protein n=1 Tax=Longimicrobium sp. TaxID=2029185 RepID=UPI002C639EEA|nr:hypothetical protein [Longimicrobium sp.]HSU14914.1 hypothetical protein [Longimicrobium sp.]
MSTGGPDPNREDTADPDTARGDFGNSSTSRLGMPSMLTGLLVVAIAIAVLAFFLLRRPT